MQCADCGCPVEEPVDYCPIEGCDDKPRCNSCHDAHMQTHQKTSPETVYNLQVIGNSEVAPGVEEVPKARRDKVPEWAKKYIPGFRSLIMRFKENPAWDPEVEILCGNVSVPITNDPVESLSTLKKAFMEHTLAILSRLDNEIERFGGYVGPDEQELLCSMWDWKCPNCGCTDQVHDGFDEEDYDIFKCTQCGAIGRARVFMVKEQNRKPSPLDTLMLPAPQPEFVPGEVIDVDAEAVIVCSESDIQEEPEEPVYTPPKKAWVPSKEESNWYDD
jgi:hypothetical protein